MDSPLEVRLQAVFARVFPGSRPLADSDSPATVEGWDSVGHLLLASELEAAFGVRFSMAEIAGMQEVRAIKQRLAEHGVA